MSKLAFNDMLKQLDDLTPDPWTGRYDQLQYKVMFTTGMNADGPAASFHCIFKAGQDFVWFLYSGSIGDASMHINELDAVKDLDWFVGGTTIAVIETLYRWYERAKHGA